MQHIAITSTQENNFPTLWELYQASFPLFEQRDLGQQQKALTDHRYHLDAYYDANEFVGFVSYWEFANYIYIEHFAISQQVRSRGYGSAILNSFIARTDKRVILEIDPLVDQIAKKRWEFYKRCHLFMNDFTHLHPPYQVNEKEHSLLVLCSIGPLSLDQYNEFNDDLRQIVMHDLFSSKSDYQNIEDIKEKATEQESDGSADFYENVDLQPVLENQGVALVPLAKVDFEALFLVASDKLIWEQHPNKDRSAKDVFQAYFDGAIQSKGAFKIVDKVKGEVIGCTRFYEYNSTTTSICIGYTFFSRDVWGKGINSMVKKMMLDYIFNYVSVVNFHVSSQNIRSQRAIERLGATKTETYEWVNNGMTELKFTYALQKKVYLQG